MAKLMMVQSRRAKEYLRDAVPDSKPDYITLYRELRQQPSTPELLTLNGALEHAVKDMEAVYQRLKEAY